MDTDRKDLVMGRFDGQVALVSGGARGMGASHVRALVAEGAQVVIGDVLDIEGAALADELGESAEFVHLDVTRQEDWTAAAEAAERRGPLTVLVNNAGVVAYGPIADGDAASFRTVVDINLVGVWLGMAAVVPAMKRVGGGAIVNISSSAGLVGFANISGYVASKWGVRGLTKAAALELGRDGIRVNSVHPGPIRTPMTEGLDDNQTGSQPIARFGEAREVTDVVLFLASSSASYVTGSEVAVDGGQVLGGVAEIREG